MEVRNAVAREGDRGLGREGAQLGFLALAPMG